MSEKLEQLISRWEESVRDGHERFPEELTVDCPEMLSELKEAIQEIQACDRVARSAFGNVDAINDIRPEDYCLPQKINGRYQLMSPLGIGHFGTVWRATDTTLSRDVAIKIPSAHLLYSPEKAAGFVREARLLAEVSKKTPHIVTVFDLGTVQLQRSDGVSSVVELPFIVMELMEGTLAELDRELFSDPLIAAQTIENLARALHAAHVCRSGPLVHRDIKPNNIFYQHDADGTLRVKLGDFGLALSSDAVSPGDYTLYGVLDYIAPERLSGEPGDVRSDIYSLGVVFYMLLTGREPFSGQSTSAPCIEKIVAGTFPPPATVNPKLNQYLSLQRICQKAMAAAVRDRYDNAAQFADALRTARQEVSKDWKTPGRFGWLKKGAIVLGLALIAIAAIAIYLKTQVPENAEIQFMEPAATKEIIYLPQEIPVHPTALAPETSVASDEMNRTLQDIQEQLGALNERIFVAEEEEAVPPVQTQEAPAVSDAVSFMRPADPVWEGSAEPVQPLEPEKPKLPEKGVNKPISDRDLFGFIVQAYSGSSVPDNSLRMLLSYLEINTEETQRAGLMGIQKLLEAGTPPPNDVALAWPHLLDIYRNGSDELRGLSADCLRLIERKYELTERQHATIRALLE